MCLIFWGFEPVCAYKKIVPPLSVCLTVCHVVHEKIDKQLQQRPHQRQWWQGHASLFACHTSKKNYNNLTKHAWLYRRYSWSLINDAQCVVGHPPSYLHHVPLTLNFNHCSVFRLFRFLVGRDQVEHHHCGLRHARYRPHRDHRHVHGMPPLLQHQEELRCRLR